MKRIAILLNAEGVQTLAMARSLRRQGFRVVGFCNKRASSGYVSRYLDERHKVPDITYSPKAFKDFLDSYLQNHSVTLIVPLADDGACFLSLHKEDYENLYGVICAVPSYPIFDMGSDKQKLMELCAKLGVSHPRTHHINFNNINELVDKVGFPALIKPNHSQGAKGIVRVENLTDLQEKYAAIYKQFGDCTLQKYVNQPDYYYNVMLYRNRAGVITGSTVIKIRRFFPIKGGSSCYCETIEHSRLVEQCKVVLDSMDWHGFADFDILEDISTGELDIIEINPRMPSSLQASFAAGVDFGKCIVSDLLDGQKLQFNYNVGMQVRWMGLDVMWFLFSKNRFRFSPSWFRFFGKNVSYQDGSWKDPLPMLAGFLAGVIKYLNPFFRKSKLGN